MKINEEKSNRLRDMARAEIKRIAGRHNATCGQISAILHDVYEYEFEEYVSAPYEFWVDIINLSLLFPKITYEAYASDDCIMVSVDISKVVA